MRPRASASTGATTPARHALVVVLLAAALLGGCAAFLAGTDQRVEVETRMRRGTLLTDATCRLTNSKGTWFVTTPGTVVVRRALDGLNVHCATEDIDAGPASLAPAPAHDDATQASGLVGSAVGVAIENSAGAGFRYPERLFVEMRPLAPSPRRQGSANPAASQDRMVAEDFARALGCGDHPAALPTTTAIDDRTHAMRCTNGDVLIARCAWGRCRVVH